GPVRAQIGCWIGLHVTGDLGRPGNDAPVLHAGRILAPRRGMDILVRRPGVDPEGEVHLAWNTPRSHRTLRGARGASRTRTGRWGLLAGLRHALAGNVIQNGSRWAATARRRQVALDAAHDRVPRLTILAERPRIGMDRSPRPTEWHRTDRRT